MKKIPFEQYRKRNYQHITRNWRLLPELRERYADDVQAYAADKKARALEFTTATLAQAEDFRISIINQIQKQAGND